MRLITRATVDEWKTTYPDAASALDAWVDRVLAANWNSLVEVRRQFPHADCVIADSGRPVTIFNVRGNRYRLLAAIHYRGQRVYTMRFLTHAEYDDDKWKREL